MKNASLRSVLLLAFFLNFSNFGSALAADRSGVTDDWDGNIVYYLGGGPVDWQPKVITDSSDELEKEVKSIYPRAFFVYKHQTASTQVCHTIREMRKSAPNLSGKTILVGHSYGASAATIIARCLRKSGLKVDLVVYMDMVPRVEDDSPDVIPGNIVTAFSYFQAQDLFLQGLQFVQREDGSVDGITRQEVGGKLGWAPHFGIVDAIMLRSKVVEQAVLSSLTPQQ